MYLYFSKVFNYFYLRCLCSVDPIYVSSKTFLIINNKIIIRNRLNVRNWWYLLNFRIIALIIYYLFNLKTGSNNFNLIGLTLYFSIQNKFPQIYQYTYHKNSTVLLPASNKDLHLPLFVKAYLLIISV